jgi:hypothetical protein
MTNVNTIEPDEDVAMKLDPEEIKLAKIRAAKLGMDEEEYRLAVMNAMGFLIQAYCSPLWERVTAMGEAMTDGEHDEELDVLNGHLGHEKLGHLFDLAGSAPVIWQMVDDWAVGEWDKWNNYDPKESAAMSDDPAKTDYTAEIMTAMPDPEVDNTKALPPAGVAFAIDTVMKWDVTDPRLVCDLEFLTATARRALQAREMDRIHRAAVEMDLA